LWFGKEIKLNFIDKFDIIYALQQTWMYAVMTIMRWYVEVSRCEKCCHDLIWNNCGLEIMWQVNFRPILCKIWIRADDRSWCLNLTWGDMLIGTDEIWCCLDQIYITRCIGKTVTTSFHDQFEVLSGLERMIFDDALT
jgi:hypothetical protein